MYFIEQYALQGDKLLITLRDKVMPVALALWALLARRNVPKKKLYKPGTVWRKQS